LLFRNFNSATSALCGTWKEKQKERTEKGKEDNKEEEEEMGLLGGFAGAACIYFGNVLRKDVPLKNFYLMPIAFGIGYYVGEHVYRWKQLAHDLSKKQVQHMVTEIQKQEEREMKFDEKYNVKKN
jgi:hypothetical protein